MISLFSELLHLALVYSLTLSPKLALSYVPFSSSCRSLASMLRKLYRASGWFDNKVWGLFTMNFKNCHNCDTIESHIQVGFVQRKLKSKVCTPSDKPAWFVANVRENIGKIEYFTFHLAVWSHRSRSSNRCNPNNPNRLSVAQRSKVIQRASMNGPDWYA